MRKLALLLLLLLACGGSAAAQPLQPLIEQSVSGTGTAFLNGKYLSTLTVNWQTQTTARYLMIFDSTTPATNGATTLCSASRVTGCLAYCAFVSSSTSAPGSYVIGWGTTPMANIFGLTVAMSTGTSCATYTADTGTDTFFGQAN